MNVLFLFHNLGSSNFFLFQWYCSGEFFFLFFKFKVSKIASFPTLIECKTRVHIQYRTCFVWLSDWPPTTGLEPPPEKGTSMLFPRECLHPPAGRLVSELLRDSGHHGEPPELASFPTASLTGTPREPFPFLVHSPVGVEMPRRDPLGLSIGLVK